MEKVIRIGAEEVRERVTSGAALLVCAYDDETRFAAIHLEDAVSLGSFKAMLHAIPKDREIIFY